MTARLCPSELRFMHLDILAQTSVSELGKVIYLRSFGRYHPRLVIIVGRIFD
jgi:hypothetical protein